MINGALFVYIVISSLLVISSKLASSNGSFLILILVVLVILIFCCLAMFFSLFIVARKKAQRNALSRKTLPSFIKNESNRTMRKVLTQFSIYFRRYSPDHVSPPLREQYVKSTPLKSGSNVQESGIQNRQWLSLVEECVELFDELDKLLPDLNPTDREMALHVTSRLQEILTRSGVEVITHDALFDPTRHRLVPPGRALEAEQAPITIISPGFAVGRLVLRHARVRLTERLSPSDE